MYRAYFNLKENPFTTSPDPRFFYLAPSHSESVAKCEYAIRNKSGLAVVYGDVGTGKTTILNELRERFGDVGFTIAVMNNPNQTSDTALLKAIAAEFGLKPPRTKQGAFDQLQEFLAREVAEGRTPLREKVLVFTQFTDTARLFIRLIDSLLQLLSEAEPQRGNN